MNHHVVLNTPFGAPFIPENDPADKPRTDPGHKGKPLQTTGADAVEFFGGKFIQVSCSTGFLRGRGKRAKPFLKDAAL